MPKKNNKKSSIYNFNEEINHLFEKLIENKNKGLASIDETKRNIISKFDKKIDELYQKRDFISNLFVNKKELLKQKLPVWKNIKKNSIFMNIRFLLSMPIIYMMIIPGLFFHFFVEVYHRITFRLYGIPLVKARDYFIFDRRLLPYLNWLEKFNCFYCSYYNCLMSYCQEIIGRTEKFWCPIKHSNRMKNTHQYYDKFLEYSEAQDIREKWQDLRKFEKLDDSKKINEKRS